MTGAQAGWIWQSRRETGPELIVQLPLKAPPVAREVEHSAPLPAELNERFRQLGRGASDRGLLAWELSSAETKTAMQSFIGLGWTRAGRSRRARRVAAYLIGLTTP